MAMFYSSVTRNLVFGYTTTGAMLKRSLAFLVCVLLAALAAWALLRPAPAASAPTLQLSPADDLSGFARATDPITFSFPRDHGPHEDFQTEWWYYTGNLQTAEGRHFGYQLTFFRRGLTPGLAANNSLTTNQIYFAHLALTDVDGTRHQFAERFSRGAAGLAGASGQPFRVWLEDWRAEALDAEGAVVHLQATDQAFKLDLTLRATKPIVAHGDRGLSPKSAERGNASYYLSYTRMATDGVITLDGQTVSVSGESWFDHEWSTSALGAQAQGWDWFSLQLSDGREVMFFQIRRADGGIEAVSGGTLIEADGTVRRLPAEAVQLAVTAQWTSPATQTAYPAGWRLSIPTEQIELTIEPWLNAQEMRVSFAYWEGAVQVRGTSKGVVITGNGYIELTGYSGSMQGVF